MYTTDTDFMESITIKIFEGERHLTKLNYFVGEFLLTGIEHAMRGVPQIEVKLQMI